MPAPRHPSGRRTRASRLHPGTLARHSCGWPGLLLGGICILAIPDAARAADPNVADLEKLRLELVRQQAKLKQQEAWIQRQEAEITRQTLHLSRQSKLLDKELSKLRAAGQAPGYDSNTASSAPLAQPAPSPAPVITAQAAAPTPSAAPPTGSTAESAPITGPSQKEQQARRTLEAAPTLSRTGGVLTPRGELVIDPSIEYDYWNQNQLALNGFSIIPGITFGNIFISKVQQNIITGAVTARLGVTDRLEVNVKLPYVFNYSSFTAQEAGPNAQFLYTDASNNGIGDVQFGASYQFNSGNDGWPIFVGNLLYKSNTGTSPFDVPIITVNDPNGQFLEGIEKKTPTGTGFNAIEPSITVLWPTAPGVLFANLQYIHNFGRSVNVQSPGGGPGTSVDLSPGDGIAATLGIGFALNDRTSLTLSYQQQHNFSSTANGQTINGSSYDFGTFNFGMGYQISKSTSIDVGIGIGTGPNAPAAKVLVEVPVRFNVF